MNGNTIRFVLGASVALALFGCASSEPEPAATGSSPTASNSTPTDETKSATTPPETAPSAPSPAAPAPEATLKGPQIVVTLEGGKSFTLQLDSENAPKSSAGIAELVKKKFYDGTRVHRVEPGFCVQWGDPLSKNGVDSPGVGTGGSGSPLPFEPGKLHFTKGVLGVASKGAGTGGDGQIFVMTGDSPSLDGGYAAIGKVVKGMDVVTGIARGDKVVSMKIEP